MSRDPHPCFALSGVISHLAANRCHLALCVIVGLWIVSWTAGFVVPCVALTVLTAWTTWTLAIQVPSAYAWMICSTICLMLPGALKLMSTYTPSARSAHPVSHDIPWWWLAGNRQTVIVNNAPPAPQPAPAEKKDKDEKKDNEHGLWSILVAISFCIGAAYSIYVTYEICRDYILELDAMQRRRE